MKFFKRLLNIRGQSTVEYILLFAVMATITLSVLSSNKFKKLLGKDSALFEALKDYMEYSYRHGSPGNDDQSVSAGGGRHDLYKNPETGKTRFFIPTEKYPDDL